MTRGRQDEIPASRAFAGLAGIVVATVVLMAIGFIPPAFAGVLLLLGGSYFVAIFVALRRRKMRR